MVRAWLVVFFCVDLMTSRVIVTVSGPRGIPGNDGAIGATGSAGPEGPAGPEGRIGATGSQGLPGPQGSEGVAGPRGSTGATGNEGKLLLLHLPLHITNSNKSLNRM